MLGNERVLWQRKRPKETSSKAKTTRISFSNQAIKVLSIPIITDGYNYYMEVVNEFNYLIVQNAGLWHMERGGHQVLEY
jgi:hypothetical protein